MSENQYNLIVVGGGISGLTAAYTFKKRMPHARVVVLEGKDRVGGRTLTVPLVGSNGVDNWDMGGQWVGTSQSHVMRLLDELGLETYPQNSNGEKLQRLGGSEITSYSSDIPSLTFWALIDLYWHMTKTDRYQQEINPSDPFSHPKAKEWDAMTLSGFLDQTIYTEGARETVETTVRVVFGCEPNQISFLFYLVYVHMAGGLEKLLEEKDGAAQELRIKGGAQRISLTLMQSLGDDAVRLADPVKSLCQTDNNVEVTTESGWQASASYVIVATPPRAMEHMSFTPELSSLRQTLSKLMPMGSLTKVILTYETAFWREAGLSGQVVSNGGGPVHTASLTGPVCLSYDASTEKGSPALVAFLGGNVAVAYSAMRAKQRQEAVLEHLSLFFGPQVKKFLDYAEKDWHRETLSWGSPVSYLGPGGMDIFTATIRKPEGRIHFSGTEAATVWTGYMSGAVQAGEATALSVLYRIDPNYLSKDDLKDSALFMAQDANQRETRNSAPVVTPHRKIMRSSFVWLLSAGVGVGLVIGAVYLADHALKKTEF